MPPDSLTPAAIKPNRFDGWQGVLFVAATYVYFLIFAQFGFLRRLAVLGIEGSHLKPVMAAMAIGGILISLLAPRTPFWECPKCRLQTAFLGCAQAAALTLLPLNSLAAMGISLLIGCSLGLLTVTLVSNLPIWIGYRQPLLKIGLGTGIGYFICNFPPLFNATPDAIAIASAAVCLFATAVANRSAKTRPFTQILPSRGNPLPFGLVLAWFTALVWLDSAAFFIIQNSPALKSGTWEGSWHLWRTGILHLAAALAASLLLVRRGAASTLALALAILAAACLLLLHPDQIPLAAILYPIGVSLYSVTLVAYPSFLMATGSPAERTRRAGYLYAAAGWVGSAMGIGMAQNLHHVPPAFVLAAAALFFIPLVLRVSPNARIQLVAVVVVIAAAFGLQHLLPPPAPGPPLTAIERGRQVYIAEGCIHCHSQYVRPNSPDVAMWGPATDLEQIRLQQPPLIGNRRQGPDLSQVGNRRSPLWLRIHFMNPRDISSNSIMPRFDYLFSDGRGEDLIAYLVGLDSPESPAHRHDTVTAWQLPSPSEAERTLNGEQLFHQYCGACHLPEGTARQKYASSFKRLPPNLLLDPLQHIPQNEDPAEDRLRIARIIKFGLAETDMAGHEYLPDAQVQVIADWIVTTRQRTAR